MSPTGAADIALVILRLSAAAAFLAHGSEQPFFVKSLTPFALVFPAGALCLGLLTTLCFAATESLNHKFESPSQTPSKSV
jgi:uncharacterized membrane protein YphA (DoxX/SURF4 family)